MSTSPMSPDQPAIPDRYKDRPLLRLLDCYILDVIGELPQQQKDVLEKLEPRLREVFGSAGQWREIVEEQMGFLPSVPLGIETVWASFQENEQRLGRKPSPSEFVREFVTQNFPEAEDDQDSPGGGTT
jgi:hypothetical protein